VAQRIRQTGGRAEAVAGDITSAAYVEALVAAAARLGGGKIHHIVNNAGYTYDGVIHKMGDAQWEAMLAVHNTAPFRLIRAAAPYFRVRDGANRSIVNISSTSGVNGNAGQANYGTAKAGVVGLTKVVSKEWGPQFGVRANTVAFGRIDTRLTRGRSAGESITTADGTRVPLGIPEAARAGGGGASSSSSTEFADIPLRRAGSAQEAAASILALASPLASYITGQTVLVTGGR
jgi:3-oxoacyl-[acyl-carrier protein] reductase